MGKIKTSDEGISIENTNHKRNITRKKLPRVYLLHLLVGY